MRSPGFVSILRNPFGKSGGGGGGQPQQVTQTTNTTPWSGQQPFLAGGQATFYDQTGQSRTQNIPGIFQLAHERYQSDSPSFFPGQTFAGPSSATQSALGMQEQRALQGSPLVGQAQGQLGNILGGGFLSQGNPYLANVANSVASNVIPQVQGAFSGAGRLEGGAGQTEAMSRGIANAIAPFAFQDYSQARGMLPQAAALAPQLAAQDYFDASQLAQVGAAREGQQQQQISENIARHEFEQNVEAQKLAQLMQLIQGNYGGQTIGTSNYTYNPMAGSNPLLTGLGVGSSLIGMGGGLFGPFGIFPGALGGGAAAAGAGGGLASLAGIGGTIASGFSDRRLKTDIERIGTTEAGIPIYKFRYLGHSQVQIGVMADEARKVIPHAVHEIEGFLAVDYSEVR